MLPFNTNIINVIADFLFDVGDDSDDISGIVLIFFITENMFNDCYLSKGGGI